MKNLKDKSALDMAYNTQLEELIMPEYGRNVQQLVRHAQTIEKDEYRQAFCEEIVTLIQQLYPQSKSIEDYREKLWKHLFHIAKYKLNAKTPSGEVPRPEDAKKKPERVPYPPQETRFKHYGNNVQVLIRKAMDMEPGPIKSGFVNTIGSYMKLAYKTWNREHYVSDEIIKNDLAILSKGKISLEDDSRIDGLAMATRNRNQVGTNNNNKDIRERERNRSNTGGRNDMRSNSGGGNGNDNRRDNRSTNNKPTGNNANNNSNNNRNNNPLNKNKRK
jgi:Domain of unknown function (DUF4290)